MKYDVPKRDIFDLAHEMADLLAERPEVIELQDSEDALHNDPAAVALVKEYEKKKRAVKMSKTKTKDEQLALITEFMDVEDRWNASQVIQRYYTAREQIDLFMENLNLIITYPVTGEEFPTGGRKTGCSSGGGGCSSDGGGCGSGG